VKKEKGLLTAFQGQRLPAEGFKSFFDIGWEIMDMDLF
jgi:hypothetical protein